jgi:hypothetical protein
LNRPPAAPLFARIFAVGVGVAVAASSCTRPEARTNPDPPATSSSAPRAPRPEPVEAGESGPITVLDAAATDRAAEEAVDLAPYATQRPVWGKSIGHTSVVFKLRLEGGREAAWKPRSKRGANRYRGEIAAYRLGRALGITNVPPALPRAFPLADLRASLGDPSSGAGKLLADEAIANAQGEVRGAIIPWIVDLHFLDLEAEPKRSEWRRWLAESGSVPQEHATVARQISTMIVFDYLTGNWDRWSGGNVGTDAGGETVLFIDNDGAFFDPPPPAPLAKQRALLAEDARFSRSFIAALRALGPEATKAAMGEDEPGVALLAPRVLAGLEERRQSALLMVDAKIKTDGEDKVLCFE